MDPVEITKYRRADPFVPIRLRLRDGRAIRVLRPAHFLVTQSSVIVGLAPFQNDIPDRTEYIHPDHIVHVEPLSEHNHP